MNPKDVQILLGLFVIAAIVSWFTLGPVVTIILALGILLIIGIAALLKKFGKKGKRRTVLNVVLIVFLSFCILGALAVGGFMLYIVNTAPEFDPNALKNQQSSILYDRDGNEMTKLGAEVREDVTYDRLPQVFVDALIAIEDSRFFQHNGFDAARFLVASLKQVTGQKVAVVLLLYPCKLLKIHIRMQLLRLVFKVSFVSLPIFILPYLN